MVDPRLPCGGGPRLDTLLEHRLFTFVSHSPVLALVSPSICVQLTLGCKQAGLSSGQPGIS